MTFNEKVRGFFTDKWAGLKEWQKVLIGFVAGMIFMAIIAG